MSISQVMTLLILPVFLAGLHGVLTNWLAVQLLLKPVQLRLCGRVHVDPEQRVRFGHQPTDRIYADLTVFRVTRTELDRLDHSAHPLRPA